MTGILYALAQVIEIILNMVQLLIFLSVLISWFSADPRNPLVNMVRTLTEPMYAPIRRHLTGRIPLPLDFAPMVLWLLVIFIQKVIQFQFMTALR